MILCGVGGGATSIAAAPPSKAKAQNNSIWLDDHSYVKFLVNFTKVVIFDASSLSPPRDAPQSTIGRPMFSFQSVGLTATDDWSVDKG